MWYMLIWFLFSLVVWFFVIKYLGSKKKKNGSDKSDDKK